MGKCRWGSCFEAWLWCSTVTRQRVARQSTSVIRLAESVALSKAPMIRSVVAVAQLGSTCSCNSNQSWRTIRFRLAASAWRAHSDSASPAAGTAEGSWSNAVSLATESAGVACAVGLVADG